MRLSITSACAVLCAALASSVAFAADADVQRQIRAREQQQLELQLKMQQQQDRAAHPPGGAAAQARRRQLEQTQQQRLRALHDQQTRSMGIPDTPEATREIERHRARRDAEALGRSGAGYSGESATASPPAR